MFLPVSSSCISTFLNNPGLAVILSAINSLAVTISFSKMPRVILSTFCQEGGEILRQIFLIDAEYLRDLFSIYHASVWVLSRTLSG